MRFSLGATISRVAALGVVAKKYVKDNLKIYFDFKSSRAKTLEFVGTGSTYFTTNDYMTASRSSATSATFSFSGWVKATDINAYSCIFSSRTGSDNDYETGINIDFGSGASQTEVAVINVEFGGDGRGAIDVCNTTIAFGVWFHLAITVSNVVTCYINGVAQSSTGAVGSPSIDLENMQIGARYYSSTIQRFFEGNLKNVAIWTRALSASEVQNIMYKTYSDLKGTELTHLVSWWGLDSSSDTYADSHGDNDGTNSGSTLQDGIYADYSPRKPRGFDNAPTAQADLIGSGSCTFNRANNDHILIADAANLSSSNHSLVFWIKFDDTTNTYGILNKYDDSVAGDKEWRVIIESSAVNFIQYNSNDQTQKAALTTTTITVGQWHHYAFTHDGSNLKGYMDGVLEATTATGGIHATLNAADRGVVFGANYNNGSIYALQDFDGSLAQVGWFSGALTQEQVQSIKEKSYDELSSSEKTNLESWWGLDVETATDGTAGTGGVKDSHSTNHGTLV